MARMDWERANRKDQTRSRPDGRGATRGPRSPKKVAEARAVAAALGEQYDDDRRMLRLAGWTEVGRNVWKHKPPLIRQFEGSLEQLDFWTTPEALQYESSSVEERESLARDVLEENS